MRHDSCYEISKLFSMLIVALILIGGYQILCTSLSMICKIMNRGSSNADQCYVSPKWNFKERHS